MTVYHLLENPISQSKLSCREDTKALFSVYEEAPATPPIKLLLIVTPPFRGFMYVFDLLLVVFTYDTVKGRSYTL